jgi:glycosyltransferase involved in cell wall biosynthesis
VTKPGALLVLHSDFRKIAEPSTRHASMRVAIIVGYYNGAKYIADQINSIAAQSHREFEVIVFKNCSSAPLDNRTLGVGTSNPIKVRVIDRAESAGFPENFLQGLASLEERFEFYAFRQQTHKTRSTA